MITPLASRWSGAHHLYSNNPERVASLDGSVETWSRQLTRLEDLPVDIAARLPDRSEALPYCVRSPAVRNGKVDEPESFLFLKGRHLVLMKRRLTGVSVFQADLATIEALETETELLHSCITLHPQQGSPQRIPFNTVVDDLFAPLLATYVQVHGGTSAAPGSPDPCPELLALDYRYHRYAHEILAGVEATAHFHHPAEPVPSLFNGSRLIPSYLLVSSGSMLYSLSEPAAFRPGSHGSFGLRVLYLPLTADFTLGQRPVPGESRYQTLVLRSGQTSFDLPLAASAAPAFAPFAETLLQQAAAGLDESLGQPWDRKVG